MDLFNGASIRFGQRYDTFPGGYLTSLSFWLLKNNLPTGTGYARVRLVSDDSIIGTIGSVDVATFGGAGAKVTFNTTPIHIPSADVRFTFEYDGGDAANYVRCMYNNANTVAGDRTQYSVAGGWAETAGEDATFEIVYFPVQVSATAACTAAEHDITVYADTVNLGLTIDGGTTTAALGGATVPNNTNNWVWGSNSAPYFGQIQYYQGANYRINYLPADIIHGAAYSTGTATFTNGAAAVVGAGTTWTSAMEGSVIWSATDLVSHIVLSVADTTNLTLASNYSAAGGAGHNYIMLPCLINEQVANNYDGGITFGSNPAGVTSTSSGLVSGTSYAATVVEPDIPGVLPVITIPTAQLAPGDAAMQGAGHLLRPIVNLLVTAGSFPIAMAWAVLFTVASLAVGAITGVLSKKGFITALLVTIILLYAFISNVIPLGWVIGSVLITFGVAICEADSGSMYKGGL